MSVKVTLVHRTSTPARSTWIEVSAGALRHNLGAIAAHVGKQVAVCAVIKSDAYGHGAAGCAQALHDAGARWFAVSSAQEGISLRGRGIKDRILVLSGFWPGEEDAMVMHELTPTVWEPNQIDLLQIA